MLILKRNLNEEIIVTVGGEIVAIMVTETRRDSVRLGFTAGPDVTIHRKEIHEKILADERTAATK